MWWRAWNKVFIVSSAMAVGGVMVCAAGLFDVLVPKGSVLGFVAGVVALGMVITSAVAGYAWLCDKCEDYLSGRMDRLLRMEPRVPREAANRKEMRVPSGPERRETVIPFSVSAEDYVQSLRGHARPQHGSPRVQWTENQWHGQ